MCTYLNKKKKIHFTTVYKTNTCRNYGTEGWELKRRRFLRRHQSTLMFNRGYCRWTIAFVSMEVNEGAWIIKRTVPLFIHSSRICSQFPMNSGPVVMGWSLFALGLRYDIQRTHSWSFWAERAVDLVEATNSDKHCGVSVCDVMTAFVWLRGRVWVRDSLCMISWLSLCD
jgi:hypothetical protein